MHKRSNSVLHLAKASHAAQVPILKDILLPLFAIVFFVVRVAASPFSLMWPLISQGSVLGHYAVYVSVMQMYLYFLQVYDNSGKMGG